MAHVQKRKGRGWVARYRMPNGTERSRSFDRKVDAERFLSEVDVAQARGSFADPRLGRMRLQEWVDAYRETTVNLRPSTRARDESYLANHILPVFGDTPLAAIDHLSVRSWLADLSKRRAPATVHKAHQILSKILQAAVDTGRLASNPCVGVPLPRIERHEMRFLDHAEVMHLANAMDPRYRGLVVLSAYSGLRIGEALALRQPKVDLMHRTVEVAETLAEVRGELIFGPPKTRAGQRRVPLPRVAADALQAHLAALPELRSDLVFTAPEGGPIRLGQWRQRFWRPAVKAAGLDPLRIHDLRHTAVAFWIAAEATPTEIARRAGHSSVVTVLDRYGHLLPGTEDRVNDALDRMAEQAANSAGAPADVVSLKGRNSG